MHKVIKTDTKFIQGHEGSHSKNTDEADRKQDKLTPAKSV